MLSCHRKLAPNDRLAIDASHPIGLIDPIDSTDGSPHLFASAPRQSSAPNAACAVAYVNYPTGTVAPHPGDDLSAAQVPMRIPAGASLTIAVRKTSHELTLRGPAVFRPCTNDEPEVILVAMGEAVTDGATPIQPGSELIVATPSCVAVVGRASLRLRVDATVTHYEFDEGAVSLTNLEVMKRPSHPEVGDFQRVASGGPLLTRCGEQAAGVASAERRLGQIALGGPGAPQLPASSIGALTAEQITHAREKQLDCSLVEAFALSCEAASSAGVFGRLPNPSLGCLGGYQGVKQYVAKQSTLR
ncbi:MAG: hypothetical protein NVS3B20_12150 [Polyangiales bacterium]